MTPNQKPNLTNKRCLDHRVRRGTAKSMHCEVVNGINTVKAVLTAFFYVKGVVHHEFSHRGQTVNKNYYIAVLRRFIDTIQRK